MLLNLPHGAFNFFVAINYYESIWYFRTPSQKKNKKNSKIRCSLTRSIIDWPCTENTTNGVLLVFSISFQLELMVCWTFHTDLAGGHDPLVTFSLISALCDITKTWHKWCYFQHPKVEWAKEVGWTFPPRHFCGFLWRSGPAVGNLQLWSRMWPFYLDQS